MFRFATARARPRISLTPMIDVVFLLLVFFMLVARFGLDQSLSLAIAGGGGAEWSGPPRLVDVGPEGLRLNGVAMDDRQILLDLVGLTETGDDLVILRPADGATTGRLVEVLDLMERGGFTRLAVVGAR